MDVIRAETAGFCMGVSLALQKLDTALAEAEAASAADSQAPRGRICTLGPIIHNPQVLAFYESRGVTCLGNAAAPQPGDRLLIRAHGIPRQEEERIRASQAQIMDATCPKVKKAQLIIAQATREGGTLLLFGEADHPEVRGLVSYAHGPAHVFGSPEDLAGLHLAPGHSYVLASQTTQDRETFIRLEASLRERFPGLTVLSTICDATRERQAEARRIAAIVDVMVVVGGKQSGNTRRLADVAALSGIETFHVESVDELDAKRFMQKTRAGLTAGASTPKRLIDAAENWLAAL